jgi:hypothetical protein
MGKKQGKNEIIKFTADVAQVKTMADGGIRITLDLAESETETAMKLMDYRRESVVLGVAIAPVKRDEIGQ